MSKSLADAERLGERHFETTHVLGRYQRDRTRPCVRGAWEIDHDDAVRQPIRLERQREDAVFLHQDWAQRGHVLTTADLSSQEILVDSIFRKHCDQLLLDRPREVTSDCVSGHESGDKARGKKQDDSQAEE